MSRNMLQQAVDEIYDECEQTKFNGWYGDSLKDLVKSILHVYDDGREVSEVECQLEMLMEDIETLKERLANAVASKLKES